MRCWITVMVVVRNDAVGVSNASEEFSV
jgi:hypothetical protein